MLNTKIKGKIKMLKKILDFIDGVFEEEKEQPVLGTLYKIKGENLPFKVIRATDCPVKDFD